MNVIPAVTDLNEKNTFFKQRYQDVIRSDQMNVIDQVSILFIKYMVDGNFLANFNWQ
jgi:hypothetical protein